MKFISKLTRAFEAIVLRIPKNNILNSSVFIIPPICQVRTCPWVDTLLNTNIVIRIKLASIITQSLHMLIVDHIYSRFNNSLKYFNIRKCVIWQFNKLRRINERQTTGAVWWILLYAKLQRVINQPCVCSTFYAHIFHEISKVVG